MDYLSTYQGIESGIEFSDALAVFRFLSQVAKMSLDAARCKFSKIVPPKLKGEVIRAQFMSVRELSIGYELFFDDVI